MTTAALARLRLASGALLVLAVAGGFVRSTTVTGRPDQGNPLFWKNPHVTYVVNTAGFRSEPGCSGPAAAAALVRRSLAAWSAATRAGDAEPCTSFRYLDGGDTTRAELGYDASRGASNVNLVVFRQGLCASFSSDPDCRGGDLGACIARHDCWSHDATMGPGGTLALTTVTYVPDTGEILDADVELNGWNGDFAAPAGWYFTCVEPPAPVCAAPARAGCIEIDVGNTVTHEAGHMLGLDHVCEASYPPPYDHDCARVASPSGPVEPVMSPSSIAGETDKRQLKPDDVAGVCAIYPDPVAGGSGCRTGGGSAMALLALALGRRGRQRTIAPA